MKCSLGGGMRGGDVGRGGWNQLETDGEEETEMIGRQDGRETEQKAAD